MSKYTCYIIDDEPLAIDVIATYLNKLSSFEIKGTFTDPIIAFEKIKEHQADLIFLDIEMPDLTGLEFIKTLSIAPHIIITTAYREFAVEGFELNILDYLLKPITFERFMKAIDKFLNVNAVPREVKAERGRHIVVRSERKFVKIPYESIAYIQGIKDYVKIVLDNGQVLTKMTIGAMAKKLDPNEFLRVHRSYIIGASKVTAFTKYDVEIGKYEIPIGQKYKANFERKFSAPGK